MVCQKCGNQVAEGAGVCNKCGANALSNTEICERLKANMSRCSVVKGVSIHPKHGAVIMKGKIHNYKVNEVNGTATIIKAGFSLLLSTLSAVFGAPLAIIASGVAWEIADGYGFDEENTIPLIVSILIFGIFQAVVYFLGRPEKEKVSTYFHDTMYSKTC